MQKDVDCSIVVMIRLFDCNSTKVDLLKFQSGSNFGGKTYSNQPSINTLFCIEIIFGEGHIN